MTMAIKTDKTRLYMYRPCTDACLDLCHGSLIPQIPQIRHALEYPSSRES